MREEDNKSSESEAYSKQYPLKQLYFYLTEGCNLACRHCWLAPQFDPDGSKNAMLPLALLKKAIEEAIPLGLTSVKLTGGEPLLHPNFLNILDFLKEKRLDLTLETNGILLTEEIARAIAEHEKPFVSVSLDGANAATHDKIRGVEGSFAKAKAGICNLVKNHIHPQVIMSIMRSNADQAETLVELAETLGADSVKFNIIQPTGRGEAIHGGAGGLGIHEIIALGRKVEKKLAAQTSLSLYFDYPSAFRSLSSMASDDGCGVCGILSILGVLSTGEYALCGIGSHVKELVFGKAGNDPLAKIWHENLILLQLRSGLPEKLDGVCSRCLMKHRCLGSCIAQNYYRTHSLWEPFWFCAQAEEKGLFPESRLNRL